MEVSETETSVCHEIRISFKTFDRRWNSRTNQLQVILFLDSLNLRSQGKERVSRNQVKHLQERNGNQKKNMKEFQAFLTMTFCSFPGDVCPNSSTSFPFPAMFSSGCPREWCLLLVALEFCQLTQVAIEIWIHGEYLFLSIFFPFASSLPSRVGLFFLDISCWVGKVGTLKLLITLSEVGKHCE